MESQVDNDKLKVLVLSFQNDLKDDNTIHLSKLVEINHSDFIEELTLSIKDQIEVLSLSFDKDYFITSISLFSYLINHKPIQQNIFIPMNQCLDCLGIAIEKLSSLAFLDNTKYNSSIIESLCLYIKDLMGLYPKETQERINKQLLIKAVIDAFGKYRITRLFIYQIVANNESFYSTLKDSIKKLLGFINESNNHNQNIEELIRIAQILFKDFKLIRKDFYVNVQKITSAISSKPSDNHVFYAFFGDLCVLVFKEKEPQYEIINLLLQFYDENITNNDICLLIMRSLCKCFTLTQYMLIRDSCDYIGKIINQFHKLNDCQIPNFYLKWIETQTYHFDSIDFSKELQAICKSFPNYNTSNSLILQIILDRLMDIFNSRHDMALYFLEKSSFFQYIDCISTELNNTIVEFIEKIFKICVNEVIMDYASKTKLLHYNILDNENSDDLLYRKITIILSYESNSNKFNVKANELIKDLHILSNEIFNDNEYEVQTIHFIDLFKLLLRSLSQDENNIVSLLDNKLFEDIRKLLMEFTEVLLIKEYEPCLILKLWNVVFAFIYDYNMAIIKKNYQNGKGMKHKTPMIITKREIREFIEKSMNTYEKLEKKESIVILLRYLYEKCINYQSDDTIFENQYNRTRYAFPMDTSFNYDTDENKERSNGVDEDNEIDAIENDDDYVDLMKEAIEQMKLKYKLIPNHRYNNIILQSQFILKSLISVIFSKDNTKDNTSYKLSLISFMQFLCNANPINISLILQCKVIQTIFIELHKSSVSFLSNPIESPLLSFLHILLPYLSKRDLTLCFKYLYIYLAIDQNNLDIPRTILNSIDESLQSSSLNRNHITIASINTDNPSIYQLLYIPKLITNPLNCLISLHTPSLESLRHFCLCYLSRSGTTFSIILDQGALKIYLNDQIRFRFELFAETINDSSPKHHKNKSNNKSLPQWYNFIIQTAEINEVIPSKDYIIIQIENILFNAMEKHLYDNDLCCYPQAYDFSIGFIDFKTNLPMKMDNSNEKDITYTQQTKAINELYQYIDVSYVLISKEVIESVAVNEMNMNNIFSSKKGSAGQVETFKGKTITAEIFFNDINLSMEHNLSGISKKIKEVFNYSMNSFIPTISSNDGICSKVMYLLKHESIIHYASMNHLYTLETINKRLIKMKYLSFESSLEQSISDVFFRDMFFIYLYSMNSDLFNPLHQLIFNIILQVDTLSSLFFTTYLPYLNLIFKPHIPLLNKEFARMLTIHPIIVMPSSLSHKCIIELYLHPYFFTSFSAEMQLIILKKIVIFIQHEYNSDNHSKNQDHQLFLIKTKLIFLLMHFELKESAETIFDLLQTINEISSNKDNIEYIGYYSVLANQIYNKNEYKMSVRNNRKGNDQVLPEFEFISSDIIDKQINTLLINHEEITEEKEMNPRKNNNEEYIIEHFKAEYEYFNCSMRYDKKKKRYDKTLRLLWPDLFDNYSQYSWCLSDREGYCRMKKKIVLKENDINITEEELEKKLKSYAFYWTWLEKLALYEHHVSFPIIGAMINKYEKHHGTYMCLLIKNNIKTNSLLILSDKRIYIITNVIIDINQRFHLNKTSSSDHFWASNEIDKKEWNDLINTNKQKKDGITKFNYDTEEIRIKTISYLQISELHKRNHLHQPNSLELFTLKGSSYFITVFPRFRDEVFTKILTNINNLSLNSKVKNISKASSSSSCVFMKHYPIVGMRSKKRCKGDFHKEKTVITTRSIADDITDKWSQSLISNFHYLMLINTLGGRSYNDLTQYFIFPWMVKKFFGLDFNPNDDEYYRDFSYPLHAQIPSERPALYKLYNSKIRDAQYEKEQFERKLNERRKRGEKINKNEKYVEFPIMHSGHYYSNFSFVCYLLLRLNPFTSISFSVKETFSQGDRCFNSMEHLGKINCRYFEWIPELFYLPELLININNYKLGVMTVNHSTKRDMNDVIIPQWADSDPRTVSIIFNKILESPKVSEKLNNWIDLVFGYKLIGKDCIEALNLFSQPCYPYAYDDIRKISYDESHCMLVQTDNMGCCPTQLFTKAHIARKFNQNLIPFHEKHSIIGSLKTKKDISLCNISFKGIGDMKGRYECPRFNVSNGEGGLSSLNMFIDQLNEDGFDSDLKARRSYMFVGKKKTLLGPRFTSVLSHNHTSVIISLPHYYLSFDYNLKKPSNIASVISSLNGKYIIVGFSNGSIIKYRKRINRQSVLVYPYSKITAVDSAKLNKRNYLLITNGISPTFMYYPKSTSNDFDYWKSVPQTTSSISMNKASLNKQIKMYVLIEENITGLSNHSIHLMDLCESYSFLLIADDNDHIYQYDFNQVRLLYHYSLHKVTSSKYTIKHIKIIPRSGDYLIGTKYSIHLFSINGLPIVDMNIFDLNPKLNLTSISSYEVVSVTDTIIFTGHSNGMMAIWKLKTDSYEHNSNQTELPLFRAYHERYQKSFKEKTYKASVQKRELDNVRIMHDSNAKIIYIKLSDDGMRLYYIDKEKTVYQLNSDDYVKDKTIKILGSNIGINKTVTFNNSKDSNSSINLSGLCTECTETKSTSFSDRLIHD